MIIHSHLEGNTNRISSENFMSQQHSPPVPAPEHEPLPQRLNDREIITFVQMCQKADVMIVVKVMYEVEGEVVQHRGIVLETTAKQFTWVRQNIAGGATTDPAIKFGVSARGVFNLVEEKRKQAHKSSLPSTNAQSSRQRPSIWSNASRNGGYTTSTYTTAGARFRYSASRSKKQPHPAT